MSFDPVLNNEIPAVTETEITKLPLLNPDIVRNLGLRPVEKPLPRLPIHASIEALRHAADGSDDKISVDWTPTTTTSSAFDTDDSDEGPDSFTCTDEATCPTIEQAGSCACFHKKSSPGHHASNDSPDSYSGIHHMRGSVDSTGETSSTGSSISLPDPKIEPLTPTSAEYSPLGFALQQQIEKQRQKSASHCGVVSNEPRSNSSSRSVSTNSSVGSEVEVDGGVALTEEGVGNGLPDIATE
jgi:hypothetical protein